ncbi:MAG TPA: cation transporter, partial [Usitatibacter sp.]|nr:cation transporter [Usitatibacter sp.]
MLDRAAQDLDAAPRLRPLCLHCGLPSAAGASYCCPGCEAIAAALAGLPAPPAHTDEDRFRDLAHYDDPAVAAAFVRATEGAHVEALFVVEGLRCGACAWLVERAVGAVPGVCVAEASFSTARMRVLWDPALAAPSRILAAARACGYGAWPCDERRLALAEARERRSLLRRFLVATLAMMQVMMYAVPAYIAAEGDITPDIASLMRWAGLVLTAPVIAYCAAPIFAGAWRDAALGRVGMDAPVALGLGAAFAASVAATLAGTGDVYFDSVAMFVFLVTGARYLEMTARHRAGRSLARLGRLAPEVAHRIEASGAEIDIPAAMIRVGDRLRVRAGEAVAADGVLEDETASLDESLLTGESRAVTRSGGE